MAPQRPASALVDDLVEEVLLRCPPDDPAVLVRAAVVCKGWRRVVSGRGFRRRFCELHRTAPMLGFLYYRGTPLRFEPTTSFRPRYAGGPGDDGDAVQSALDARHGRVLLSRFSPVPAREDLVVWDPVGGGLRVLPVPRLRYTCCNWNAAYLCAAAGCDHLDCARGRPFCVVFVGTNSAQPSVSACIYSSVHGKWSALTSVQHTLYEDDDIDNGPGVLVGNALHFLFKSETGILKYDLDTAQVSVIELPLIFYRRKLIVLAAAEDGRHRLGLATTTDGPESNLVLWSMEVGSEGVAVWVQIRAVELMALLPADAILILPEVVGFVEGVGVVIVRTHGALFTIDIKSSSSHVKKIGDGLARHDVVPYVNFHTPGSCVSCSNLLVATEIRRHTYDSDHIFT